MAKDDSDFSHSLADLMTSLAIVFLILAVAMVIHAKITEDRRAGEYDKIIAKQNMVMQIKRNLLDKILDTFEVVARGSESNSTDENCISIDGDSSQYSIKIRFSSDELCNKNKRKGFFYEPDKYISTQDPTNTDTINKLVLMFKNLCSEDTFQHIDHVQILGHTDDDFSRLDKKNCEQYTSETSREKSLHCENIFLSAQRARDVFLRVGGNIKQQFDDTLYNCFIKKTEISGRGPFDPSAIDVIEKGKNRRVEIILNFKQPRIGP